MSRPIGSYRNGSLLTMQRAPMKPVRCRYADGCSSTGGRKPDQFVTLDPIEFGLSPRGRARSGLDRRPKCLLPAAKAQ